MRTISYLLLLLVMCVNINAKEQAVNKNEYKKIIESIQYKGCKNIIAQKDTLDSSTVAGYILGYNNMLRNKMEMLNILAVNSVEVVPVCKVFLKTIQEDILKTSDMIIPYLDGAIELNVLTANGEKYELYEQRTNEARAHFKK